MADKITFNRDQKFDLQLSKALVHERRLAEVFANMKLERMEPKVELKTETWQWKRTGNIAIEYRRKGKPSGISVTEADFWIHQLCADDGTTLGYLLFPIEELKRLCRIAHDAGHYRLRGGDRGEFDVILLRLEDILKWLFR